MPNISSKDNILEVFAMHSLQLNHQVSQKTCYLQTVDIYIKLLNKGISRTRQRDISQ